MFSMQFKKCSTRSEVGDVFYLCSQGVQIFVLDQKILSNNALFEATVQLQEVFSVFEKEYRP